jgi:hypothetical protein
MSAWSVPPKIASTAKAQPASPVVSTVPKAPAPPSASPATPIAQAHSLLDRSEGRAGPSGASASAKNPPAHARAEHTGRKGAALESRGKDNDGAFFTPYDQDKALASALANGGAADQTAARSTKGVVNEHDVSAPAAKPWQTAPLVREVEKQPDGTYEHFNAKVNKATTKFSKDTGMAEGSRVQTIYGSDTTRLEKPLPGGSAPATPVSLSSISDTGKLRKTDTVVKDSSATGKVVDAPKKASTPEVPSSASPTSAGPTTI